jgi:hypothetical protein
MSGTGIMDNGMTLFVKRSTRKHTVIVKCIDYSTPFGRGVKSKDFGRL